MFDVFLGLFTMQNMLVLFLGVTGGMMAGAVPGLTAVMAIALLIPFTFALPPATGIMMLMAIYTSAIYGGSISAILLHTPGTPASAATALDGYPLTLRGKGHIALRVATFSSMVGGFISAIALLTLAPPLSRLSLLFGPPEYFLLAIFGLTIIGSLTSGSIVKGLIAGGFGLLLGTVGVDINVGFPRFTFGIFQLQSGVPLIPAMIGLFSLSQILEMSSEADGKGEKKPVLIKDPIKELARFSFWELFPSKAEIKETYATMIRSSLIGIGVGMLPGAGGDIGSWIGYNEAKRFSKNPEEFGTGSLNGVSGSETANNAVTGAALIPMLTLGIPGSSAAAVLLGGLMIHGLVPGRELFTTHASITYTALFGFALANILMGLVGFFVGKYAAYISVAPKNIVIPIIITFCVIGSFSVGNNMFDVWVMIFFGIVGLILKRNKFHPAPVVLGLILGPMAEVRFTQALKLSRGNLLGYFMERPISVVLIILIVLSIAAPLMLKKKKTASKIKDSAI